MNRVWHLNGKSNMICGQRVCVCGGAHEQPTNNWQSVEQRVGFTTLVVPRLSTGSAKRRSEGVNCKQILPQAELVKAAPIDHPHVNDKW